MLLAVETLRRGYIRLHRKDDPRLRSRLTRLIHKLDAETLTHVVRAFNTYFSLVNIAEEAFQDRERQRTVRQGGPLWTGSFDATLKELKQITARLTALQGADAKPPERNYTVG